jgi:hypothetical protein
MVNLAEEDRPTVETSAAVCVSCGEWGLVCCDDGNDGAGRHEDPRCKKCCGPHSRIWAGKSVAGGTYERSDCDQ